MIHLIRFFLIQRKEIENFGIFGRNFPEPEVADPTRPKQQKNDQNFLTRVESITLYTTLKKYNNLARELA